MPTIASLIRQHREQRGWTQMELARRVKTNQTQISQWETGREPWVSWQVERYFDRLISALDYPEDMLGWWVERQITEVERTISKTHEFKEQATRRRRSASVLTKLDDLIERTRRERTELTDLYSQLQDKM